MDFRGIRLKENEEEVVTVFPFTILLDWISKSLGSAIRNLES